MQTAGLLRQQVDTLRWHDIYEDKVVQKQQIRPLVITRRVKTIIYKWNMNFQQQQQQLKSDRLPAAFRSVLSSLPLWTCKWLQRFTNSSWYYARPLLSSLLTRSARLTIVHYCFLLRHDNIVLYSHLTAFSQDITLIKEFCTLRTCNNGSKTFHHEVCLNQTFIADFF